MRDQMIITEGRKQRVNPEAVTDFVAQMSRENPGYAAAIDELVEQELDNCFNLMPEDRFAQLEKVSRGWDMVQKTDFVLRSMGTEAELRDSITALLETRTVEGVYEVRAANEGWEEELSF